MVSRSTAISSSTRRPAGCEDACRARHLHLRPSFLGARGVFAPAMPFPGRARLVSGARGRDRRPAFDALCRDATKRQFDMVMAWSVDRLGRSLQDLVAFLSELHALRVDLFLHQQGLDTTTPAGKAMFQMLGVFAEFERSIVAERVRAGLARARAEGKRRPPTEIRDRPPACRGQLGHGDIALLGCLIAER